MIEVTCGACGSTYRFAEADIPPGGKTVTCAKCKARVSVPPRGAPSPDVGGGTGDVISLADLPAPKRASPLAGVATPARPMPSTKLPPLPTPAGRAGTGKPGTPPPSPGPSPGTIRGVPSLGKAPAAPKAASDFSPLEMDSIDLPAPVGPEPRGFTDLPAPVGPSPRHQTSSPGMRTGSLERGFASEPMSLDAGLDLPAPKRASGLDLDGGLDLPAPKRASGNGGGSGGVVAATDSGLDLPAPKRASGLELDGGLDLPAPKRASGGGGGVAAFDSGLDLPAPKRASVDDGLDLLAPKGASLMMPGADLPAPKGFFDDLPAPKSATPSVGSSDLPAPKGFFDDLPAPKSATPSVGSSDLPAPKGFFDDLPGPRSSASASGPAPTAAPTAPPARGKGMDLDDFDLAPPTLPPQTRAAAATAAPAGAAGPPRPSATPLELDDGGMPALELDAPSDRYNSLDLPSVSPAGTEPAKAAAAAAAAGNVVSFKPGSAPGPEISPARNAGRNDSLDLDIDDSHKPKKPAARPTGRSKAVDRADVDAKPRTPGKLRKILLVVGLVVVVAGAGGFFVYQRWQKQEKRSGEIDADLAEARRSLADGGRNHWQAAASAGKRVLEISKNHEEALAIVGQAHLAGYLDEGTSKKKRLDEGTRTVETLRSLAAAGPQIDKAIALYDLVTDDVPGAIKKLSSMAKRSKDPDVHLFLGWAHAAARDWKAAIAAYSNATGSKNREVPAYYGKGMAELALGDLAAARASFGKVNELAGKHLGAQVGVAAAMPPAEYARRETELSAILKLDEIAKADPRVVALAWSLAGDDARRGGRLDEARARYRKALELIDEYVPAIVGNAELALLEDRLDVAETEVTRALTLAPDDTLATLAAADLDVRKGRLAEAATKLDSLKEAKLANPSERARVHMLDGRRLEASKLDEEAVKAYEQAQQAAGDGDIAPTVAAATVYTKLAAKAKKDGKVADEKTYSTKAEALIATIEAKASADPGIALTLGRAYLAGGDGVRAEKWLLAALAARPGDVEAHFQLAEALELQGKKDAAVEILLKGFELDRSRVDVGLELARTLENAGRNKDAAALYGKLLEGKQVSLDLRMRAGLFFARNGDPMSAADQGAEILAVEERNAAGLFLKAEGLYYQGSQEGAKFDEARKLYKDASDLDPQALYLDGLGRASEMTAIFLSEGKYRDEALRAYKQAADLDPKMMSSQIGKARLYLTRREYQNALDAFEAARQIDPSHPDIPYGLGVSYDELNNDDKAIEWLAKSNKVQPRADVYFRLAVLYEDNNKTGPAASAYREATRYGMLDEQNGMGPQSWLTDTFWKLADLDERNGNERGACDAYDKYMSRNPTDQVKVHAVKVARQRLRCR